MTDKALLIGAGLALVAAGAMASTRRAGTVAAAAPVDAPPPPPQDLQGPLSWPAQDMLPQPVWGGATNDPATVATDAAQEPAAVGLSDPLRNVAALREAIAWSEGTASRPNPYAVVYGFEFTITDFSRHPALLGWKGGPLTDKQCAGAGMSPGCVSTAAGKYQFNLPTWREFAPGGEDADFTPATQDAACDALLRATGAYDAILRGDLAGAVALARKRWASLPGAGYAGQPTRRMDGLQAAYTAAGGVLA